MPRAALRGLADAHRLEVGRAVAGASASLIRTTLEAERRRLRKTLLDTFVRSFEDEWAVGALAKARPIVAAAIDTATTELRVRLAEKVEKAARETVDDVVAFAHAADRTVTGDAPELDEVAESSHAALVAILALLAWPRERAITRLRTRLYFEFETTMSRQRSTVFEAIRALSGRNGVLARSEYLVDRIARTELMTARNKASQAAIESLVAAFPDVQRLILATFDAVTAYDSVFVHGELRGVDEPFTDGAGRVYMVPPARPNDREIVIPWRASWPLPDWAKPVGEAERVAAWYNAHAARLA